MAAYESLARHLADLKDNSWVANFSDIEAVLRRTLPESARKYEAWWSNSRQGSRHNRVWLNLGWVTTDVSLSRKRVTFRRIGDTPRPQIRIAEGSAKGKVDPQTYDWDIANSERIDLAWSWHPLGAVTLDDTQRLHFPKVPAHPAIYRIRIRLNGKESRYVGEAENIARRFQNYRNPGPTQQTSLRINATLKAALRDKAEVSVACVFDHALITKNNGTVSADLSSKVIRCLFENAVLCAEHAHEIESLNRATK